MSGRGIKAWAPYKSLKEQWSTLDDVHEQEQKVEKPTISSDEAEEINELPWPRGHHRILSQWQDYQRRMPNQENRFF